MLGGTKMARVAQRLDRLTAAICIREINSQNSGEFPRLAPTKDSRNFFLVSDPDEEGPKEYALSKGNHTLVMRVTQSARPAIDHLDFRWVEWQ